MKSTRVAWSVRLLIVLAVAALPAAAAQAQQPPRTGTPGQFALSPPTEEETLAIADVALAASPVTFGTSYVTVSGEDFTNFYTGGYDHSGSGSLRWPASGTAFITAQVPLPPGVTVTEIEFYVVDNNAATGALLVYRSTPGLNTLTLLAVGTTTGASTAVATYPVTITPYVVDTTTRLVLGINTSVLDGTIAIAGARVGYTGSPGQLVMFPAADRFVDTRTGRGGKNTKYVDGEAFDHTITGVAGLDGNVIPLGALAILGNVVAVNPTQNGQFKVLPGGTATTLGRASVNYNAGFNTGNAITVRLDSAGQIRGFHTSPGGTTDLVVDVVGYYR